MTPMTAPPSAPEKLFNELLDRIPSLDKLLFDSAFSKFMNRPVDQVQKDLEPFVKAAVSLLILRTGPGRIVKLTRALHDAGLNVPVLDKRQARAIWGPASTLLALLVYRSVLAARAAGDTSTNPATVKPSPLLMQKPLSEEHLAQFARGMKR
jgi:hypothetical protein